MYIKFELSWLKCCCCKLNVVVHLPFLYLVATLSSSSSIIEKKQNIIIIVSLWETIPNKVISIFFLSIRTKECNKSIVRKFLVIIPLFGKQICDIYVYMLFFLYFHHKLSILGNFKHSKWFELVLPFFLSWEKIHKLSILGNFKHSKWFELVIPFFYPEKRFSQSKNQELISFENEKKMWYHLQIHTDTSLKKNSFCWY